MHLLLIHQAFATPREPGGTRHFELGAALVDAGHRVTVITSDTSYLTHRATGLPAHEVVHGIEIFRLVARAPNSAADLGSRVAAQIRFAIAAFRTARHITDVDVIVGTSPPLFQAVAAALAARARRAAFVLEVRDLWPAFAVQMGALQNRIVIRVAEWVEGWLYRSCDALIVNSPGFVDHVRAHGAAHGIVHLVTNGVDTSMFDPSIDGTIWRERLGAHGKPLVMYAGALGAANGLDTILDAASLLDGRDDIRIALIGEGSDATRAKERAASLGLRNLVFHPPVAKTEMPMLLAAADVCVATLRPIPLFGTTFPNKIFDYLAAGRPIVSDIQGPIAQVVADASAGITVQAGDSRALADALHALATDPARARRMGTAARKYVVANFDRNVQAREFRLELEEAVEAFRCWRARVGARFVKRTIDLVLGTTALVLLMPVMAVIGLLIAVRLGRPIVFSQHRIGLDGRQFRMLKFRSMTDQRDASGALLPDDARLTRFGRWLRRWSLDELLQLTHVVRGEMSLVGPRPLPEDYRDRYARWQWRRHYVRPGITGWAQINGRNAVEWDARFAYDMWYTRNWSIAFDAKILVRTLGRVVQRVGINQPGRETMSEFTGPSEGHPRERPRVAIFLSVRDKATRLPGKVLADIHGEPALVRLIRRLKSATEADLIVLTTSVHPDDAELIAIANREGVEAFAGSEDDKLQRYLDAAREFGIEFAVVVDGDDLLVSVEHLDAAIRSYRETGADFISQYGLPLGAASFGIRITTLAEIVATKDETNTEVWGSYFTQRHGTRVLMVSETDSLLNRPDVRMTLDYPEDLQFFRAIFAAHQGQGEPTFRDAMMIISKNPTIVDINAGVQTLYEANLAKAAPVRFKA